MFARWRLVALVGTLAVSLALPALSADSQKESKKVIPAVKADESLDHIDVFEGIEQGLLDVKMIPKDALGGNILIENKGAKPLNVDFPRAFIGKQVLKQLGLNGGPGGPNAAGPGGGSGNAGGGGAQIQGGGIGQNSGNNNNGALGNPAGAFNGNGVNGNGFFSVPTDKVIRVAYHSVCLEHGKPAPSPRMIYRLAKVEEFSDDPILKETLMMVASGKHDPQATQAAAWHVANKMSWKQLAEKTTPHIGRAATFYFSDETLARAEKIHATAVARAKEQEARTANRAEQSTSSETIVKRD